MSNQIMRYISLLSEPEQLGKNQIDLTCKYLSTD